MNADDTKARILKTIADNISSMEAALNDGRTGYVFFWPEHCLSVRVLSEGQTVCAPDRATIVKLNDGRTFTNGAKQRAVLIDRREALQRSIAHSRRILATLSANYAA